MEQPLRNQHEARPPERLIRTLRLKKGEGAWLHTGEVVPQPGNMPFPAQREKGNRYGVK